MRLHQSSPQGKAVYSAELAAAEDVAPRKGASLDF